MHEKCVYNLSFVGSGCCLMVNLSWSAAIAERIVLLLPLLIWAFWSYVHSFSSGGTQRADLAEIWSPSPTILNHELVDNVVSHIISAVWKDVTETSGQWWMENSAVVPDGNDGPLSKWKPWWFLSQSSLLAYCEALRNMSVNIWLKEVVTNRNSRDFWHLLWKCWTQNDWSQLLSELFFLLKMIDKKCL